MSIKKKLLQAAAGTAAAAGGEAFAEGIGLTGYQQSLYLNSNLNNTTSTKTFTLSFWIYMSSQETSRYMQVIDAGANDFSFYVREGQLYWYIANSSNSAYSSQGSFGPFPYNQWNHIVISQDFSSTSNRHAYINDIEFESLGYGTYVNQNAGWNSVTNGWAIGSQDGGSNNTLRGRLAHVYFDETYRDLSNVNNRRLFVTEDLKPAEDQASLNPPLYMSFNEAWWENYDTNSNALNEGTGQDFSVNTIGGEPTRVDRGPNLDNCAAAQDGGTFYLTSTNAGFSASTKFTLSCTFYIDNDSGNKYLCYAPPIGSAPGTLNIFWTQNQLSIFAWNGTNTRILDINIPNVPNHMWHSLQISLDKTDTSKRHFILNGESVTPTITTYNSTSIPFGNTFYISRSGSDDMEGTLGEFFFDTEYMDLATSNPFWDDTNYRHVPMRTVLDETGLTPNIACPMLPPNTGLNLGTQADLTPAAGQYNEGGRGGSENWAYGFEVWTNNNNTQNRVTDSHTGFNGEITLACAIYNTTTSIQYWGEFGNFLLRNVDNKVRVDVGTFAAETPNRFWSPYPSWNTVLLSYNYSTNTIKAMVNGYAGISVVDNRWANLTGSSSSFPRNNGPNSGSYVGWLYVHNGYMDVTDKNVNKHFLTPMGYPRDLRQPIDNGDIPNPLAYLDFRDTSNVGSNYGTSGDWTFQGGDLVRKALLYPVTTSSP